jgi:hypothetical protein
VNYRLTVPGTPGSAIYPDHYQDLAASVAWVHSHTGDYGGDPDGEKQQWVAALGNNPDYLTATSATRLIRPGIGIPPIIGRGARHPTTAGHRDGIPRRRRAGQDPGHPDRRPISESRGGQPADQPIG